MRHGRRSPLSRLARLAVAGSLVAACAALGPGSAGPSPEVAAERARREQAEAAYRGLEARHAELQQAHQEMEKVRRALVLDTERLERERQALQETLRKQAAAGISEDEVARLRLQLLERDAQIQALGQKLDAAIQEVVRAMAKLRSLESRAEAATSLAEAEIAVRTLEPGAGGRGRDAEVEQAEQLLRLGGAEFRKDNYGGALYLSTEAKSLIKGRQARSLGSERVPKVPGEVPFALPLRLRVTARVQAREGPGPTFKVAFALPEGAPVTGQSYRGQWVRVQGDDGRWGWIPYGVVAQR